MVSTSDRARIKRAFCIAKTSEHRYQVGAVIVAGGKMLGESPNISKNNPRFVDYEWCTIHAEIGALRQVRKPKGSTIYIARVSKTGSSVLAKPCARCALALYTAGVDRAVWTTDESYHSSRLKDIIDVRHNHQYPFISRGLDLRRTA